MTRSMKKYQLEHFKDKVDRQFKPYIEEQELIVKQLRTEANSAYEDYKFLTEEADKFSNQIAEQQQKQLKEQAVETIKVLEKDIAN